MRFGRRRIFRRRARLNLRTLIGLAVLCLIVVLILKVLNVT